MFRIAVLTLGMLHSLYATIAQRRIFLEGTVMLTERLQQRVLQLYKNRYLQRSTKQMLAYKHKQHQHGRHQKFFHGKAKLTFC